MYVNALVGAVRGVFGRDERRRGDKLIRFIVRPAINTSNTRLKTNIRGLWGHSCLRCLRALAVAHGKLVDVGTTD